MLADSLLESHFPSGAQRGWTTLTSFALQTLAIGAVLILPLIYTEGLPKLHLLSVGARVAPPPGLPATPTHAVARRGGSNAFRGLVMVPSTIPALGTRFRDDEPPQDTAPCAICVLAGPGSISTANSIFGPGGNPMPIVPPPPAPTAHPPRISHLMEGNLIHRVEPVYPHLAQMARIQGTVMLRAIISRTGSIENLQVISGHPMLVGAAIDAVRQWRYRPYILNGDPVEVETQVTVKFSVGGG
jgi:protein TonB